MHFRISAINLAPSSVCLPMLTVKLLQLGHQGDHDILDMIVNKQNTNMGDMQNMKKHYPRSSSTCTLETSFPVSIIYRAFFIIRQHLH
jgi:hypothetical protein